MEGMKHIEMDHHPLCVTRSYPEMVGDMSRVTWKFDVSKIVFVRF